jgi:hypothetical protein
MAVKIDTAVIYNDETVIDVVHGKEDGLFRSIKSHPTWETIMEDLYDLGITVQNLDELEHVYSTSGSDLFTFKIKVFKGKTYKH